MSYYYYRNDDNKFEVRLDTTQGKCLLATCETCKMAIDHIHYLNGGSKAPEVDRADPYILIDIKSTLESRCLSNPSKITRIRRIMGLEND